MQQAYHLALLVEYSITILAAYILNVMVQYMKQELT